MAGNDKNKSGISGLFSWKILFVLPVTIVVAACAKDYARTSTDTWCQLAVHHMPTYDDALDTPATVAGLRDWQDIVAELCPDAIDAKLASR